MGLMELYGLSSTILYGVDDEYASKVLLDALQPHLKGLKALPALGQKPKRDDLVIYLGSFQSNPLARQAFKSLGYSIRWDALTDGSYFLKTFRKSGKTTVFVTGKDRLGTIYAANDLKNYYLRFESGKVLMNELNVVERAHLKYRWFWNWDSRTRWDMSAPNDDLISKGEGGDGPEDSSKTSETYLRDLKKTIDFMSQNRLNGLILWGFLRDSHGGVAASQELCNYAEERGVHILPGVGLGGNGGFYYEGENQFNLGKWAKAHPELRSVDEQGNFRDNTLCPEKAENREWYRQGLKWIYENFKIGGLNLGLGNLFVCYSEDCKKARQAMGGNDPDSYKDLARITRFMAEEAHKLDPDTWISYATYTGFDYNSVEGASLGSLPRDKATSKGMDSGAVSYPPDFIKVIPEFAICEWSLNKMYDDNAWPSPFKAPAKHNIGYLPWGNASSGTDRELYFRRIQEISHHAIASNLEGLVIYGEESSERPNVEINYLTFSQFAFNPATENDQFFRYRISRLYGGEEAAKKLIEILGLLENEEGMVAEKVDEALQQAKAALEVSDSWGKNRWNRLIQYLDRLTAKKS